MSVVPFHPQGMLPERIDEMLLIGRWRELEKEIRSGFPANTQAYGGTSLFELVLSASENAPGGPSRLPPSLLDAMVDGGLPREELVAGSGITAVALCAEYAQWTWMGQLLDEGFQMETPEWPAIFLLVVGRVERFRANVEDEYERYEEAVQEAVKDSPAPTPSSNVHQIRPQSSPVPTPEIQMARSIEDSLRIRLAEFPGVLAGLDRLIDAGADINGTSTIRLPDPGLLPKGVLPGAHPLMEAQRVGDPDLVIALAERGADVRSVRFAWPGTEGAVIASPLIYELTDPDMATVEALLDAGAPLGVGMPLDVAILDACDLSKPYSDFHPLRECVSIRDERDRSKVLRLFLSRMAPEDIAEQGAMAFQQAAAANRVDYMEILAEAGVSMVARTSKNGFMAIHQACANGSSDAIEYLLVHGVKLSDTSDTGVTAASMLMKHPHLVERFDARQEMGNVRILRPRN